MNLVGWLLDADPAIRWQALRDLTNAPEDVVAAERSRVAIEGWGARLLALRDPDGQWAAGACFPGGAPPANGPGQPWTSTLPTLDLLRAFGLDPQSDPAREMIALIAENCRWEHDGQRYFDGEVEPCINGRTVAAGVYFGVPVAGMVKRLLREPLEDGGWNCWTEYGSLRSSFHTTINVLEGLLAYEQATGDADVRAVRQRGEVYLLERNLFRRTSSGEVAVETFRQFSFPTRWCYDVLRALDYFRATGAPPDERMAEAVQLVRDKQQSDGTWLLENTHPGAVYFELEAGDGLLSRWNTLGALRVLRWADGE